MEREMPMRRNRIGKIAALFGGLALTVPALAAPPAKSIKYETECFEVSLPANFAPIGDKQLDPKSPWLGTWTFASTPNARIKVIIACKPYRAGVFKDVFQADMKGLLNKVAQWKQESLQVEKEGPRHVGTVIGQGFMKALDYKTKKEVDKNHLIIRMMRRYPAQKMMISMTIAATAGKLEKLAPLLDMMGDSLDPIDVKRQAQLREEAAKKAPPKK
jgi:hypothetical protein